MLATAEIKYAINGLLSLTPDGFPLLGETPEVRNLWSAAAVWIKEGPGVGRMLAEWMTNGVPEIDPHHSDITRFYRYARNDHHVRARCAEHYNKTYGIVHPREQWASERNLRCAPYHARTEALGAVYFQAGGWERPHWYESNAPLVEHYGIADRPHEWDARWWSPIMNAEHLAMRERVGMIDLAPFVIFDIAVRARSTTCRHHGEQLRRRGRPLGLHAAARRARRVPLGPHDHAPRRGPLPGGDRRLRRPARRALVPHAPARRRLGHLRRQHVRHLHHRRVGSATPATCWSHAHRGRHLRLHALPYGTTQEVLIGSITVRLFRISYVGDHGWEVYVPIECGLTVWDRLWSAGQEVGVIAVGAGVYGTTGRLEKGYRLMGAELDGEYTPVEAGLARPKVKAADFIGKAAYLERASRGARGGALHAHRRGSRSPRDGIARYMTGGEPILTLDGERIVDGKGRPSVVTSAGAGPSVGKYLLLAYLPPEHAVAGTELRVRYMNEDYPVKVAVAGSTPLFDPDDTRMKG